MAELTSKESRHRSSARSIPPPRVVGESGAIQQLNSILQTVARRQSTVLIEGESGTGKELAARFIHANSARRDKPFVAIDCTILKDTLLESELFGHVKGAFTGADKDTLGFIRAADGGTLLLDEIGELSPQVQAKLLRTIQERVVFPVGSTKPIPVNIRIIAATHRDIKQFVRKGEFREDLFYRLNVVAVHVPPLRDRSEDIIHLAHHFLAELSKLYEEPSKTLSPEAEDALRTYQWPGNVRELTNVIEHAYVLSEEEVLTLEDLPEGLRTAISGIEAPADGEFPTLDMAERSLLLRALRQADGNKAHAARLLNVERHRFYRMLVRHGLESKVMS